MNRVTRSIVAFAAVGLMSPGVALAFQNPQVPLAGSKLPQFKDPLPRLSVDPELPKLAVPPGYSSYPTLAAFVANGTSVAAPLQISMCEFQTRVLPTGTFAKGARPVTSTWGYVIGPTCPTTVQETYLGPVLVNIRGTPTHIRFTNALPTVDRTNVLAYKYSTDQTLHWADPLNAEANMCHMMSGDPPTVGVGIPAYHSECSLNFGEYWDPIRSVGGFNPVGIPAVPHLHGGEVPPVLDGGPDAWFTSTGGMQGHDYYTNPNNATLGRNEALYSYPNTQSAAPLWFHDHTLGATRLNVYAGIAGGYYLLDPAQETYFQSIQMRPVTEVIPIILQDRQFDTNGQLYFPNGFPGGLNGPPLNPEHPYWSPEFLGDTIVVNGKVWPYVDVEPRRYRFLFLNGSNARTYETFLVNPVTKVMGPKMWVIGNDGGFLDRPSVIDPNAPKPIEPHFVIMPGERYEMIIDFTGLAGQTLILKNVAKAPYPGGAAPQGGSTGQLMQFRVSATPVADGSYDPAVVPPLPLRPASMVRLTDPATGTLAPGVTVAKVRELTLNEVALAPQTVVDPVTNLTTAYPGGPVEILVNNTRWTGKDRPDFKAVTVNGITEYVSETPEEGTTELWEIVNTTMDAHPIHTHLATFQLLNRQVFDMKYLTAYAAAFPLVTDPSDPTKVICAKGTYCPGYGPPLPYDSGLTRTFGTKTVPLLGGNPDVTLFLANTIQLPDPDEVGWKDTVMAPPGMVTRFVVRFTPTETPASATGVGYPFSPNDGTNGAVGDSHGYVWHCHIIDHEDNEMMRPDVIVPIANATRSYVKGVDY